MGLHFTGKQKLKLAIYFQAHYKPDIKNEGPWVMGLHDSPHLFMAVGVFIMIKIGPYVMDFHLTGP